jgi:hypothetical protein
LDIAELIASAIANSTSSSVPVNTEGFFSHYATAACPGAEIDVVKPRDLDDV